MNCEKIERRDAEIKSVMETNNVFTAFYNSFNCNPSRNLFEARNQFRIVEEGVGLPDVYSFWIGMFSFLADDSNPFLKWAWKGFSLLQVG